MVRFQLGIGTTTLTLAAEAQRHAAQVQQEYQALFETPAGDPDAVLRWRNRAMRFVLSSETDSTCGEPAGSEKQPLSPGKQCWCTTLHAVCVFLQDS